MVKPSKLYENAQRAGAIPFRDFQALLAAFGFVLQRTRGSHRAYKHPDVPQILTVQPKGKDARSYQVRMFLSMIERFRLELDE
jgi:predicted RNA binding protein YcfA (HicA-like mRNA interferase family)